MPAGQLIRIDQTENWQNKFGLAIKFELAQRELFAGELIAIDYQIKTNDAFISLGVENNGEQREQYSILKTRKEVLEMDEKWGYQYRLTILYRTSTAGKQSLSIPALIYSEGGLSRYRIDFAAQQINVLGLPAYLPPDILRAAVDITTSVSPSSSWLNPLTTDYLYYWVITTSGANLSSSLYNDIMRAVTTDEYFEFMPAEVIEKTHKQDRQISQQVQYRIPFTVKNNGRSRLPDVQLQYYNTTTQKLTAINAPGIRIVALDKGIQGLIIGFVTILFLSILIILIIVVRRSWLAYRALSSSLAQFEKAQSPEQEREAMHFFSRCLDWPAAMGLFQWGHYWQQTVGENAKLSAAIELLARSLYSQHRQTYDRNVSNAILSVSFLSLYKLFIHRYFVN